LIRFDKRNQESVTANADDKYALVRVFVFVGVFDYIEKRPLGHGYQNLFKGCSALHLELQVLICVPIDWLHELTIASCVPYVIKLLIFRYGFPKLPCDNYPMMACLDVAYHALEANAAAVLFHSWGDSAGEREIVTRVPAPADYRPGQFYLRELPCLLALVALIGEPLELLIVDGYVWLGEGDQPGLGAHLHAALGGTVAVIGVAKSRFAGATAAVPVLRGGSRRPLFVTAAGMDLRVAVNHVETMHGEYRIPTLLKRADQLSRSW